MAQQINKDLDLSCEQETIAGEGERKKVQNETSASEIMGGDKNCVLDAT